MTSPVCRACGAPLTTSFANLGHLPYANALVRPADSAAADPVYPLHALVCGACRLVQLGQTAPPAALFSEYVYFSAYSESWRAHCARFARETIARCGLTARSRVVEVASNDGTLLAAFTAAGIGVLGVEPAANVAMAARARGIPTEIAFFGAALAARLREAGGEADLIVANNVLAHVPDPNDFVAGLAALLAPRGMISIEVPHLLRLIEGVQFDTIYHEHVCYFSLLAVAALLARHGLVVAEAEELPTHGGSLRLTLRHAAAAREGASVRRVRAAERAGGLEGDEVYAAFGARMAAARGAVRAWFETARREGLRLAGYGAPAKGSTLLACCGIDRTLLPYTVDRSPHKQGRLLPGSRIPIRAPAALLADRPDRVVLLPWNLAGEIMAQMAMVRGWGGRFVLPLPAPREAA